MFRRLPTTSFAASAVVLQFASNVHHGITVHLEPTPTGDHQANGAAEAMVHVLRSKANLLVQQIEDATGCTKPVSGCLHPAYSWAIVHSSWLHNHFVVNKETTGYERATGRFYSGKLALFGEAVMGYLKTDLKGLPKWTRGVWLTKTVTNDYHVIGTPTGIFVTRSIRRLIESFQLELLGELVTSPWERRYSMLKLQRFQLRRGCSNPTLRPNNLALHPVFW